MSPEHIEPLRWLGRYLYHASVDDLPDEWAGILEDFIAEVGFVNAFEEGDKVVIADPISVRFEADDGLAAFVFPARGDLSDDQLRRIFNAQLRLHQRSLEIENG